MVLVSENILVIDYRNWNWTLIWLSIYIAKWSTIIKLTLTICISFGLLYLVLYGSKFVNHDATLIFCFIYKWVELHSNYINYQVSALPMPEESSIEFWIWGTNSNNWVLGYCRFQWCGFYLCPCSIDSLNIQHVRFSL